MNWNLPNQLTVGRILVSFAFFVLLGLYKQGTTCGRWLLNAAFVVYILGGITDILDGYFARKWNQTSAFGRMVDPMVDKILVVGAFVMLAGNNFSHLSAPQGAVSGFELDTVPAWLTGGMFSAVQAWMVVAILVREFVISGVRGYSESRGRVFPATYSGKIKMFVQSVAVCTVLYQMANVPTSPWAVIVKVSIVWLALVVTLVSGLLYANKARRVLQADENGEN
ncbi:MAG: CDP-alcohol phosphatidyltransferase family protein [Planctomycetes bacterium]|nr:CDP-alcohol phosphatidyltransferase family protein [Planctomycetota bacterium]